MSRIPQINPESATGRGKELLDAVKGKLGLVPNMTRAMANSPAVLDGYLSLSGALGKGSLSAKQREQIALTVGEANGCDYCLAAHSAIGKMVGLTAEQIMDSRRGTAIDPKAEALVKFARRVVDERGRVSDLDLADARVAGLDDAALAEVVAHVALNVYSEDSEWRNRDQFLRGRDQIRAFLTGKWRAPRRTVGPVIPRSVASPQSRTPLYRTKDRIPNAANRKCELTPSEVAIRQPKALDLQKCMPISRS